MLLLFTFILLVDHLLATTTPTLVLPGGGIFFYHMAGQLQHLASSPRYRPLSSFPKIGASAGALASTLSHNEVDFFIASEFAINQCKGHGLMQPANDSFPNPFGLAGIWGAMVGDWLDLLLPNDAHTKTTSKVTILATPCTFPISKQAINRFDTREELISANLASIHIPFFLDGKPTSSFNNQQFVDGSFFLRTAENYLPYLSPPPSEHISFSHQDDLKFQAASNANDRLDFLKLISEKSLYEMIERGVDFAKERESRGEFVALEY